MSTLNAAYEVRESRSSLRVHLISLALTLAMSAMLIVALFVVLAGSQVIASIGQSVGMSTPAFILAKILHWILALAFVIFAFAVIYYYTPNVEEQHWYWLTPGSVLGVVFWALASVGLRVSTCISSTPTARLTDRSAPSLF